MSAWRAALRISIRESRRARGRSALVVAMIALPVLALTFAAATYDMLRLTPAEQLDRRLGTADAQLTWPEAGPIRQDPTSAAYLDRARPRSRPATSAELLAVLPAGTRAVGDSTSELQLRTATGIGELPARDLPVADPLTRGIVTLLAGRPPVGGTEVAATDQALHRLGSHLGGTVTSADGTRTFRVVGVVEFPDDLRELVVLPPGELRAAAPNWLVDTLAPLDWPAVQRLNRLGIVAVSRPVLSDPPPPTEPFSPPVTSTADPRAIRYGVVVTGLGVLEVVLLAGPAFAVGTRRRRRDLALVAANGGTPAQLRRIVLADGIVLGGAGAVVGLVSGVAAAVAGRPVVEQLVAHHRAGGYRFFPAALAAVAGVAVLTGVLAALVPAAVAARQDVVAGLTGRRGVVRSRTRWLVVGLGLAAVGATLTAVGAARVDSTWILTGLVLGELGLVLCTPRLVGLIARIGPLLPLAARVALRDTARNRAAAAPAISAVMAAVAGSVAVGTFLVSDAARTKAQFQPTVPPGYLTVLVSGTDRTGTQAVPADRLATATAGAPVTGLAEIREPACPAGAGPDRYCGIEVRMPADQVCPFVGGAYLTPAQQRQARADPRCVQPSQIFYGSFAGTVVDDGTALPLLTAASTEDLRLATLVLRAGGVVVRDSRYVQDGQVSVAADESGPDGSTGGRTIRLPAYVLSSGIDAPRQFLSPVAVRRLGLDSRQWGFVLATTGPVPVAQRDRLTAAVREVAPTLQVESESDRPSSDQHVVLIVLAAAAGLITLGAAATATGLAAADGRADLATLAAIGAAPGLRRALSLSQSGVIAGVGSLLGVGAGLGAAYAILGALDHGYAGTWPSREPYPLLVPWSVLGVLAAVPLVAMLGAGLFTRSRLPIERRPR